LRKKKRKGRRLGWRGRAGWATWAGLRACALAPEEKGRRPGTVCGLWVKEKKKRQGVGRLGQKREGKRGERFRVFLFFLKKIQNYFSNFQTSFKRETMHSNHDAQALIISNFIKMMFKYF
jgi:hypothetical protein